MRNYRKALAALVFALVFTTPAFAGIMVADRTPPPPPSADGIMTSELTDGIMYTDLAATAPEAADTVTEVALRVLQSVLSLV